jgi:hypothetical protein
MCIDMKRLLRLGWPETDFLFAEEPPPTRWATADWHDPAIARYESER